MKSRTKPERKVKKSGKLLMKKIEKERPGLKMKKKTKQSRFIGEYL